MDTNTMFATAAKRKLRFNSGRGQLCVEDLYDLNLEDLDRIAVQLHKELEETGVKSFIGKRDKSKSLKQLAFDICKYVIEARMEEAEATKTRAEKRSRQAFLQELLLKKQTATLEGLSEEEIQKQLAELEDEEA